ncbi:MAG: lipopolysaccharide assembly protein LapB, partial [Burkholderiaceae bacterium]|nr:lipopolysaccharide assembly protein LapB [Burkholderiaceae bacterium]
QHPATELLAALDRLEPEGRADEQRWVAQLQASPSLTAAQQVLAAPPESWGADGLAALRAAVARAARPLQRYRCAACGFEAQHYFWQCPGCLSWESYPPQRIDALQ